MPYSLPWLELKLPHYEYYSNKCKEITAKIWIHLTRKTLAVGTRHSGVDGLRLCTGMGD